ncbi:hypothetical protein LXL04_000490 [Taraxacum kok-saghyz]
MSVSSIQRAGFVSCLILLKFGLVNCFIILDLSQSSNTPEISQKCGSEKISTISFKMGTGNNTFSNRTSFSDRSSFLPSFCDRDKLTTHSAIEPPSAIEAPSFLPSAIAIKEVTTHSVIEPPSFLPSAIAIEPVTTHSTSLSSHSAITMRSSTWIRGFEEEAEALHEIQAKSLRLVASLKIGKVVEQKMEFEEKKMKFEEQKMKFEELKLKYEEANMCNVMAQHSSVCIKFNHQVELRIVIAECEEREVECVVTGSIAIAEGRKEGGSIAEGGSITECVVTSFIAIAEGRKEGASIAEGGSIAECVVTSFIAIAEGRNEGASIAEGELEEQPWSIVEAKIYITIDLRFLTSSNSGSSVVDCRRIGLLSETKTVKLTLFL